VHILKYKYNKLGVDQQKSTYCPTPCDVYCRSRPFECTSNHHPGLQKSLKLKAKT